MAGWRAFVLLKSPSKTGSVGEEESYLLQSTEMRSLILSLVIVFILKSILSDMRIATPAFF